MFAENHTIDHSTYTGEPKSKTYDFNENENEPEITTTDNNSLRDHQVLLSGIMNNSLPRINPIYNGRFDKIHKAREYFENKVKVLKEQGKL